MLHSIHWKAWDFVPGFSVSNTEQQQVQALMTIKINRISGHGTGSETGSALIYILIAVALLAALTVSMMEPSSQQSQSQGTSNLVSSIESQVSFINASLSDCVLTHPDQDSSLTATQQKNAPYPINPKDPYFNSSTPVTATTDTVDEIRCPGNPGGDASNRKDHVKLFGGNSGKYLPQPPALFDPWQYYNGADGVYFMIKTNKTDAYIDTAMTRLDAKYSKCEVDISDRRSAGALTLTSDTVPGDTTAKTCPAQYLCLRYWVKQSSTAVALSTGCP